MLSRSPAPESYPKHETPITLASLKNVPTLKVPLIQFIWNPPYDLKQPPLESRKPGKVLQDRKSPVNVVIFHLSCV